MSPSFVNDMSYLSNFWEDILGKALLSCWDYSRIIIVLRISRFFQYNTAMKKQILLPMTVLFFLFTGCTQIVTAPVKLAGAVVSTTFDVAGAAGGAVVNTVTGGSSDKDD